MSWNKKKNESMKAARGNSRAGAADSEERADSGAGEITAGLLAVIALFGAGGAWAALAPLDSGVSAPGVVVVAGNRQTVQHREGGTVYKLHVKDGITVEKGQILVELATSELKARERALMGQAIELQALRARLKSEMAGMATIDRPMEWEAFPSEYREEAERVLTRQIAEREARDTAIRSQLAVLRQRGAQLQLRIEGHQKQLEATNTQLALIAEELTGTRELAEKGHVPVSKVRALERAEAELGGRRGELEAAIQEAAKGIGEANLQAIAMTENRAQENAAQLRETDSRLAEISPMTDAVQAELERSLIRAPVSGSVVGLRVFTEGGVIRPGDPILDVVPNAQPLVLKAQVDPADADGLTIDMPTEVRFPAFAGQNLPILMGYISQVSADRMTDERTGLDYFTMEVTVPQEALGVLENVGLALKPGLPAEVVVPLRKRTALQYLVEPLNRAMWKSFRQN